MVMKSTQLLEVHLGGQWVEVHLGCHGKMVEVRVGPSKEKYRSSIPADYHSRGTPIGGYMPIFSSIGLTEAARRASKVLASQY